MEMIPIKTTESEYNVYVGKGLRFRVGELLPKNYDNIWVIADDEVAKFSYVQDVLTSFRKDKSVYTSNIPAGEQSKSFAQFESLHTDAIKYGLDRHSVIIALGGGVVGDLAGFVAATYMRGIDYIQVPTTILAHDSSVGGKVAINHPLGKNLIGSFHQPSAVIYDLETFQTLPQKEWRSGFAEVIKHAWIADETLLFSLMEHVSSLEDMNHSMLQNAIKRGIEIKANIVAQDEKESGVRSYLNFGHTLGHAIEASLGYGKITHGEAVVIGMLFALRLSEKTFPVSFPTERFLNWLQDLQYPFTIISELDIDQLLNRMKHDKKNSQGNIRMVLLEGIEQPTLKAFDEATIASELKVFQNEVNR
ncbi:3-dehydroquinate synthase [Salirhabdus euzebyi]|uniref:3-dehydroquinate synthase n=1 Tax=Salirhabdus euzebyi TaxID=394506 RepID=A0A841Q313_9BACI|nr:3-dehydroquinate synthase [Salirhabdus euzebyi]MBB6452208.1 3-dehydroquinate synthase [Salirhabdus euzebyi]